MEARTCSVQPIAISGPEIQKSGHQETGTEQEED